MEALSISIHSNANSMAKLAAYMANKGTFQGKCMLSESAWTMLHDGGKVAEMMPMKDVAFS